MSKKKIYKGKLPKANMGMDLSFLGAAGDAGSELKGGGGGGAKAAAGLTAGLDIVSSFIPTDTSNLKHGKVGLGISSALSSASAMSPEPISKAVLGAASFLTKGFTALANKIKEKREEPGEYNYTSNYTDVMANNWGSIPQAKFGLPLMHQPNVEAEGDESVLMNTEDGGAHVMPINGKSHEQGGEVKNFGPDGKYIFSKSLGFDKAGQITIKEKDIDISFAKAATNIEKKFTKKKDDVSQNTKQFELDNLTAKAEQAREIKEQLGQLKKVKQQIMKFGGYLPKAGNSLLLNSLPNMPAPDPKLDPYSLSGDQVKIPEIPVKDFQKWYNSFIATSNLDFTKYGLPAKPTKILEDNKMVFGDMKSQTYPLYTNPKLSSAFYNRPDTRYLSDSGIPSQDLIKYKGGIPFEQVLAKQYSNLDPNNPSGLTNASAAEGIMGNHSSTNQLAVTPTNGVGRNWTTPAQRKYGSNEISTPVTPKAKTEKNPLLTPGDKMSLASMAPATLFNSIMAMRKPDVEKFQENNYANDALALASRRFDDRALQAKLIGDVAGAKQNISDMKGLGTGATLANMQGLYNNLFANRQQLEGEKQKINLGLDQQQAQMMNQMGELNRGERVRVSDVNAKNKAARQAFGAEAVNNIGQTLATTGQGMNAGLLNKIGLSSLSSMSKDFNFKGTGDLYKSNGIDELFTIDPKTKTPMINMAALQNLQSQGYDLATIIPLLNKKLKGE